MYTALVHTWYEEAAVNTAGFYWEEGHRYYMVVESDVPGVANGKVHTVVVPYDFKGIVNAK